MNVSEDETEHGKPVAKLVPIEDEPAGLRSIAFLSEDDESVFLRGESGMPSAERSRLLGTDYERAIAPGIRCTW